MAAKKIKKRAAAGFNPYPMELSPVFREKIWAGRALSRIYSGARPYKTGEALFAPDTGGEGSVILNGAHKGRDFIQLVRRHGAAMLGRGMAAAHNGVFPVLVKVIDCGEKLSVQVHPDDKAAKKAGLKSGKTEFWYILGAEKKSWLLLGFKRRISSGEAAKLAEAGFITAVLKRCNTKKGEGYFVPAGTVHSLGPSNLVLEIQQNSDVTYRLYDWGREKSSPDRRPDIASAIGAVKAITAGRRIAAAKKKGTFIRSMASCEFFRVKEAVLKKGGVIQMDKTPPLMVFAAEAGASLLWQGGNMALKKGAVVFVPAAPGRFSIKSRTGTRLIITELR